MNSSTMTVYKYPLTFESDVIMPKGAQVLSAGIDPTGHVCVWARVRPLSPSETRRFHIVGTGHPLPDKPLVFIGTVFPHHMPLVWHVFEESPPD